MTCKDCLHYDVCYRRECVSDNYAEKCGNCLLEQDLHRLRGRWENISKPGDFTPGGDPIGRCPFCKSIKSIHDIGIEGPHWNFCPMCGAELT